jgi:glutaredoxin
MRKFIFLLVVGIGAWSSYNGSLPFLSTAGAYDEAGNPVVWIFTTKDCHGYCKLGRKNLDKRRVPYEEKLIDPQNDSDPNVKLWKAIGRGTFPLIVSGDEKIHGSGNTSMIVNLLGKNFGDTYLTRSERKLFKKHFYEDGSPKIVMYGADWCPYCKKLREEFNSNNIDFLEIDVEKSRNKTNIVNTLEIPGYPAVWVGYTRVKRSNFQAVKKLL